MATGIEIIEVETHTVIITQEETVTSIEVLSEGPPGTDGAFAGIGDGVTAGDFIRWNAVTEAWEVAADDVEPDLGTPDADGQVLSSTVAGVRSWINVGKQVKFGSLIAQNSDFGSVLISAPFSAEEIPDFFTDMAFWDESIDLGGI